MRIKKERIIQPTVIQAECILKALDNKDIIGQSSMCSGETLPFLLPLYQKIDAGKREMQAIILALTYELVMQIEKQIKLLPQDSGVHVSSAAIIGEVNIIRQIYKLKEKPHIIVGST